MANAVIVLLSTHKLNSLDAQNQHADAARLIYFVFYAVFCRDLIEWRTQFVLY